MPEYNQFKSSKLQSVYEAFIAEQEKCWPISSKAYYIATSFGKTFVRESGQGEPLILLPGTMTSSLMYHEIVEQLSQSYHVFAIDIVGDYGKSYLTQTLTSPEDYVQWQSELYDQLPLDEQFSILGVSMGAWLGALYAKSSERLNMLLMISPVATVAQLSLKSSLLGILPMIIPPTGKLCMKRYFRDFIQLNPENIHRFDKEIFAPIETFRNCCKSMMPQVPRQFSPEEFDNISANVLYLVGENEILYSAHKGKTYFDSSCKKGMSETISGAGHDLMSAYPDIVLEKVLSFLNS